MGVIGQSEPEPATWALLGGGLSVLPIAARSRRGPKRRTYYSVGLVRGALLMRIRWTKVAQRRIGPIKIEIFLYLAR